MLENVKNYIWFKGQKFFGARKIGFSEHGSFVLDMFTTPPPIPPEKRRGGFFTTLPISRASYRRSAGDSKTCFADYGRFVVICDDWGVAYKIRACRTVLNAIVKDCDDNEIPWDKHANPRTH